ncbi:PQQ-binding-like beta-propeller repeat protein [Hoyosella altamirensis]|uniref:PQQ-binding-like beta-propeller repeat protein n=1 Tax=Hoyosella altamirensis TaxID=616997 RepID=A0A839RKS1_9ACTN|nr:PQQ-binding-like beta-propeller repeat protein [Hoyosella altamirensis]MBB3036591.1 hypothetical protein [Hoyosella altamirensis]
MQSGQVPAPDPEDWDHPARPSWPAPPPPTAPWPRLPWLLLALCVVAVVVSAGAIVVVRDGLGSGTDEYAAAQLRGTYSAEPTRAWTVRSDDLEPGVTFGGLGMMTGPEVRDLGGTLLVSLQDPEFRSNALVAIDAATGAVRWRVDDVSFLVQECATTSIDGLVPCVAPARAPGEGPDVSEVRFYRLSDGQVVRAQRVPDARYVDVYDAAVFVAGSTTETMWIAKGEVADVTEDWRQEFRMGKCRPGGGSGFTVAGGIAWYWGGHHGVSVEVESEAALSVAPLDDPYLYPHQGIIGTECHWDQGIFDPRMHTVASTGGHTNIVFGPGQRPASVLVPDPAGGGPLVLGHDAYEFATGELVWSVDGSVTLHTIVGDVVLGSPDSVGIADHMFGYSLRTGELLWRAGVSRLFVPVASDGERVIGYEPTSASTGIYSAYNLRTGVQEWQTRSVEGWAVLKPAGMGFVIVNEHELVFYPPTGGPARPPQNAGVGLEERASSSQPDQLVVTRCDQAPEMSPLDFRTNGNELIVTMRIVSACGGGDIVSTDALRVSVFDEGAAVASGVFDLSAAPLFLPPSEGSSGADGSASNGAVTREFAFPIRSFWRLPIMVGESTGVDSSRATFRQSVECLDEGTSHGPVSGEVTTETTGDALKLSAARAAEPPGIDSEQAAIDALRALANADRPFVAESLEGKWVPQVSSKRYGLDATDIDGTMVHWSPQEILRQHLELRILYPEVRLLYTDEWPVFDLKGWWVTVAGLTFEDSGPAIGWCHDRGIEMEHCYAKLISAHRGSAGTTRYR